LILCPWFVRGIEPRSAARCGIGLILGSRAGVVEHQRAQSA
jgi:hypothetical protein